MHSRIKTQSTPVYFRALSNTPLMLGLAGGFALLAGYSLMRANQRSRRYADHAYDRRNPNNMFVAGVTPRRRRIDLSGARPLFERRQSAYEMAGTSEMDPGASIQR